MALWRSGDAADCKSAFESALVTENKSKTAKWRLPNFWPKTALIPLLCLTLSAPAIARDPRADGARWDPPAKYDHPYKGELILRKYHPRELPAACAKDMHQENLIKRFVANFHNMRGCAFPRPEQGKCWVYIIDRPAYGTTPEAALTHEIAHCNGWPSDHPE